MKTARSFLVLLLLVCVGNPWCSAATSDSVQPMWLYITQIDGTIDISTGGYAKVKAEGQANSKEVTRVTLMASLQQNVGGTWKEVKSWTASSNGTYVSLSEKVWPVAHGYSYRVVISTKAYNDNALLEQRSYTANYGYFQ